MARLCEGDYDLAPAYGGYGYGGGYYPAPPPSVVIAPRPVVIAPRPVFRRGGMGRGRWARTRDEAPQTNLDEGAPLGGGEEFDYGDEEPDYANEPMPQAAAAAATAMTLEAFSKEMAAHPHAAGDVKMTKVHCDACSGHTILANGSHLSSEHTANCPVFASGGHLTLQEPAAAMAIGCKKNKKKCAAPPKPTVVLVPAENGDDDECSSSEESSADDCAPPVPAPVVCKPKQQQPKKMLEVYIETAAELASAINAAHAANKPVNASFKRTVVAADGSGQFDMHVAVKSSARNAENVSAMHVALTPLEAGKKVANSTIGAPIWHVNHNAKPGDKFLLQKAELGVFHKAGVQKEAVQEALTFIDAALKQAAVGGAAATKQK